MEKRKRKKKVERVMLAFSSVDSTMPEVRRHPLLTPESRKLLHAMLQHPNAPVYNHRCGDRLTAENLKRVRDFEKTLLSYRNGARRARLTRGGIPEWVERFAQKCAIDVPFYRGRAAKNFLDIEPSSREDISREPWSFVPDSQPLDDLIVYETSGATGHPLRVFSHPIVSSLYLPLLRAALASRGVALEGGSGRVSIVLACAQSLTFTYAAVSSYLGGAGFIKINLNPHDWRSADDMAQFLDGMNAEIYTGDPLSFLELMQIPFTKKPKAVVSTAMTLFPEMKREMEKRFQCPVIDAYSMNEARFIAFGAHRGGHEILAQDVYVEILGEDGKPCKAGTRGEISLTCARNPFLPLLRYRTGDYAAMDNRGKFPLLIGLEGRAPVVFAAENGKKVNSNDVSFILKPFPLAQFSLHQNKDRSLRLRVRGKGVEKVPLRKALRKLFGKLPLVIEELKDFPGGNGKMLQYTTDMKNAAGRRAEMSYLPLSWEDVMSPRSAL